MALKATRIENNLAYMLNPKRAKRQSHKLYKKFRNRKQRRLMNSDLDFVPEFKKMSDYEF